MKKLISLLVAALMMFGIAGCGGDGSEKTDSTKTQLYVGAYNGGYGSAWMYELAGRFEKKYANYSFEEGKTGVQVHISDNNTTYNGDYLVNNIDGLSTEVIFTTVTNYGTLVRQNKIRDITDMVKENINEKFGIKDEDNTIEKKIGPEMQAFLTGVGEPGHYYALPHIDGLFGINYNVDLFESRLWYFSDNPNNGNDGFIKNTSEKRSAGPNGVIDYDPNDPDKVIDDGLPATYEEFYKLCRKIDASNDVIPLTWAGNAVQYTTIALQNLVFDGMGAENLKRVFDSNGPLTGTVVNGNLSNIENKTITPAEGWKVYQNEALYNALSFYEQIIDNGWYVTKEKAHSVDDLNFDSAYTHLRAQSDFVLTGHRPGGIQVAMLVDGYYWESEASNAFKTLTQYGADKYTAKYAFMPFPKKSADDKSGVTKVADGEAYAFINGNIAPGKVEVAETFLQFAYTNESLAQFTVVSGATKNVNYTLTDEQYDKLSHFEKSVWTVRAEADTVPGVSTSPLFINKSARFSYYINLTAELGENGKTYINPTEAFKDGYSAKEYFDAIGVKMSERAWRSAFEQELAALA